MLFFGFVFTHLQNTNIFSLFSDVTNEATVADIICPLCKMKFTKKANLKSHHQSVHEKLKFECEICHGKYSKKYNLTRHVCKGNKKNME